MEFFSVFFYMFDYKILVDVIFGGEFGFFRDCCLNELLVLGDGVFVI